MGEVRDVYCAVDGAAVGVEKGLCFVRWFRRSDR